MQKRYKADELQKVGDKTFTKDTLVKFENALTLMKTGLMPLYKCCDNAGIEMVTFYEVRDASKENELSISRARESFFDRKAEMMIDISERTDLTPDEKKVRIVAIEKAAQLSMPKRYRDKIDTQINIQTNSDVVRFEIPEDGRSKKE